jgi:hypothetical protein
MSGRLGTDSRFLETLFSAGTACGLTDAQLLEQFVTRHDETLMFFQEQKALP